jgi:aspartate/methionine/tyrosine aminotransferase
MTAPESASFPYMRWAKRHLTGFTPMNLGMSGVASLTPADLPWPQDVPYWAPEGEFGDPGLREAIAAHAGVPAERVFASAGSSLANFLVYHAEARGGHVAVETPGYEALLALPQAVGGTVATFARVEERDWRIDPDALRAAAKAGTRLLVVTDLHNPSGKRLHPDDLALLLEVAEARDAAVVVDEVYLELALEPARTAALASDRVIVTNSLTKAHGLGGLRIGWVLASPERVHRIAAWNDLVSPAHAAPSIAVAKAYLSRAVPFLARTKAMLRERLSEADAWVSARGDVSWRRPDGGLSGFLRLPAGVTGDALAERAFRDHGVRVIPGSFFQSPGHVRLSYGLPAADIEKALAALGQAIDAASAEAKARAR